MSRPTRVLAATDLSAPARRAAERSALLAREAGATLDLVHVASLAPLARFRRLVGGLPPEVEQRVLDAARGELNDLAAALERAHGVAARVHLASGRLLAEVGERADAIAADLVVLGAHGTSFMRHVMLGSTAERLLGRATRPMLVVKRSAQRDYRSVLVPVDFSAGSLPALRRARAIAPGAKVVLMHVYEVPFEGKLRHADVDERTISLYRAAATKEAHQKLRELCAEAALPPGSVELAAVQGVPPLRILEAEQDHDCDLVVMGKHGEHKVEDFLLGSVTRRVLAESQADVYVSV